MKAESQNPGTKPLAAGQDRKSGKASICLGTCIGTMNRRRTFESGGRPRSPNAGAKFGRPFDKVGDKVEDRFMQRFLFLSDIPSYHITGFQPWNDGSAAGRRGVSGGILNIEEADIVEEN
jgi:hypothetical protein